MGGRASKNKEEAKAIEEAATAKESATIRFLSNLKPAPAPSRAEEVFRNVEFEASSRIRPSVTPVTTTTTGRTVSSSSSSSCYGANVTASESSIRPPTYSVVRSSTGYTLQAAPTTTNSYAPAVSSTTVINTRADRILESTYGYVPTREVGFRVSPANTAPFNYTQSNTSSTYYFRQRPNEGSSVNATAGVTPAVSFTAAPIIDKQTVAPTATLNVKSECSSAKDVPVADNQSKREYWAKMKENSKKYKQFRGLRKVQKQLKKEKQAMVESVSKSTVASSNNDEEAEQRNQSTVSFEATRYAQLKRMLDKDPREVIFNLSDPMLGFKELLDMAVVEPGRLAVVMQLLSMVSQCDECPQTKMFLFKNVICSKFFESNLPRYLTTANGIEELAEVLENVFDVLEDMLRCLPAMASTRAPNLIQACHKAAFRDQELQDDLLKLAQIAKTILSGQDKESFKKHVKDELLQAQLPPDDFRTLSVTPTLLDAHNKKFADFLRPNVVGRAYFSTDHYLDVHFRLMREDLVASLRQSVQLYLQKKHKGQLSKLKVYEATAYFDVRFEKLLRRADDGVLHVLVFDVQKMSGVGEQPVDWEDTKRLKPGSLVCLSSDDFESFCLATVANNNTADKMAKGSLEVKFMETEVMIDFNKVYVMIECPAYYQAYGPVMKALQSMDNETLPFKRYLVKAKTRVNPPKYLTSDTVYDFGTIFNGEGGHSPFCPLVGNAWPTGEQMGLDVAQYAALRLALTSELALVQGPPGTGKTFLGLKMVETLLANRECWTLDRKSPMLIICYTNHALDQFLEGLLEFVGSGIVRVGGQCESKSLQKFRLQTLRYKDRKGGQVPSHVYVYQKLLRQEMGKQQRAIVAHMQTVNEFECLALDVEALAEVMVDSHRNQFQATGQKTLSRWLDLDSELGSQKDSEEFRSRPTLIENQKCPDVMSKAVKGILQKELNNNNVMEESVASKVADVWTLAPRNRWRLCRTWVRSARQIRFESLHALCREYEDNHVRLMEVKSEIDATILCNAKVVGMTTSGAAKNRRLLGIMKPRIVVVEEAAEVLEAHIVAALTQHCQHLIMIGDQQQLRPNPTTYDLAKDYGMDVSLFERLIRNNVSYERLVVQHRMRPSISRLLVPHIYNSLIDHVDVHKYPNVMGVAENVFFVTHDKHESGAAGTTSLCNQHEAKYVVALAEYLVQRVGYMPSQITVLATYKAQVQLLTNMLDTLIEGGLQCSSIDAYQGAENDIVLVSLVRSNRQSNVGFLKTENRVCVLLSRAKHGLYCIGNFNMLAKSGKVWKAIVAKQKEVGGVGSALKLTCPNHANCVIGMATVPEDLINMTQEHKVCQLPCDFRLPCGHMCPRKCHGRKVTEDRHTSEMCDDPQCRQSSSDDEAAGRGGNRRRSVRNTPSWQRSPATSSTSMNNMPRYYREDSDEDEDDVGEKGGAIDLISFESNKKWWQP